jgi:hypothetical protein
MKNNVTQMPGVKQQPQQKHVPPTPEEIEAMRKDAFDSQSRTLWLRLDSYIRNGFSKEQAFDLLKMREQHEHEMSMLFSQYELMHGHDEECECPECVGD